LPGKTNMSEFALTGIGANPHYGTPGNPADRARVPGWLVVGCGCRGCRRILRDRHRLGHGGSTRIPASFCGIVGFKPSKSRVPTDGAFPFSPALDSIGPMAKTVALCAAADAVLAGEPRGPLNRKHCPDCGLGFHWGRR
jgi:aspartyl-tRNA(Asn)/glutamyl-tRNA(Gln) amidotransferase subunit A